MTDKRIECTLLDRKIVKILDNPDVTPSRRDSISSSEERLHRLHGVSVMLSACELLNLPSSCFSTAAVIFHRYFHRVSLQKTDVWSAAMASILLAAKTEEVPIQLRKLIPVFAHLHRRRVIIMMEYCSDILDHPSVASVSSKDLSLEAKQERLQKVPALSSLGPAWNEWHNAITQAENDILRQLGFTLHWIPDEHPHKFAIFFLKALDIDDSMFLQCAWNYCNDSFRLDLCVRYDSAVIACAAIYLTSLVFQWKLADHWWRVFCGEVDEQMFQISNTLLCLSDKNNFEIKVAGNAFIRSLVKDGSFNDPDSFLWEYIDGIRP